jgi:hypothetical protein
MVFVVGRDDGESISPVEINGPRCGGPGSDQNGLVNEALHVAQKLCSYAAPLRRGGDIGVTYQRDISFVLNSDQA